MKCFILIRESSLSLSTHENKFFICEKQQQQQHLNESTSRTSSTTIQKKKLKMKRVSRVEPVGCACVSRYARRAVHSRTHEARKQFTNCFCFYWNSSFLRKFNAESLALFRRRVEICTCTYIHTHIQTFISIICHNNNTDVIALFSRE